MCDGTVIGVRMCALGNWDFFALERGHCVSLLKSLSYWSESVHCLKSCYFSEHS